MPSFLQRILSLLLIIILSPIFILLHIIIFLDDGFPTIFAQNRIGKNGKIDGTIVCTSADIEGKFKGTIHVDDLLSIRSSGEVHGDIVMSKLIVESGAVFNAKSSMKNDASSSAPLKKITNFNDTREKTA